jgi:hypothetical protein
MTSDRKGVPSNQERLYLQYAGQMRIPVKVDTIPLQSGHLSGANRTLPESGDWRGVKTV